MASAGIHFNDFTDNLKSLQEAGLVVVAGDPGAESISLTEKGLTVVGIVGSI
jgi:predicted transcriptional regulator